LAGKGKRKPAAEGAAKKPSAKKWFKGIKSVETKLNGRIGADIILLKAYK
jgi:hypothetical protein